jgi:K+-transporting ATPase ATPase C chain
LIRISVPAAAHYQVARVARARHIDPRSGVRALVARPYAGLRQWGIFGEPRVNVLELNLALTALIATRLPDLHYSQQQRRV